MKRVAVIGSGIAGLSVAHALAGESQLTLFEAGRHFGGHTHTVDVTLDGVRHGVDTGFLVFNERTYPKLIQLFSELGVPTASAEMSFSVQSAEGLEWSGNNLNSVFAQRRNLLRPSFLRMLADIIRFNRLATALATAQVLREDGDDLSESVGDFLARHRFSDAFRHGYFLPMIGCIWSCPTDQMLRFPVATLVRFCHNHGLIQIADRPQWHTVRGGARHYVERMLHSIADARLATPVLAVRRLPPSEGSGGVMVSTALGSERFDTVVLACHSDQSLALLRAGGDVTADEARVLGAIRYHPNRAVLHTDTAVLPRRRVAWAAWNYARAAASGQEEAAVCLHYLINKLQPLPWQQPVIVSLNPDPARPPDPRQVIGETTYSHPVFDRAAVAAQEQLPQIQGRSQLWFCGAWTRYGFHEDGLMSGQAVVQGLRERWQAGALLRRAA
ncbi:MAG: FAD-dependent oxidoreductase [Rubrivivax sp.]|nr:FAD-dependent oxidoreductase [Rubrivivax sp.]